MSLKHRPFLLGGGAPVVLMAALLSGCGGGEEEPAAMTEEEAILAEAQRIHDAVMTLDTHIDIPFNYATEEVDPGNLNEDFQVDYPRMQEGGLNVGFFIVYFGQTERTPENYEAAKEGAITKFDSIHRATSMHSDVIELAHTADDAERIHAEGKLVAMIGIENGYVIGKDLALLETYHGLGARYITLAHNGHNDIADSCNPREDLGDAEAEHGGISEFGKEVIAEMNRLGILVDISHISKDAMLQAAELSAAPIIASHSGAKALADVSRNMDDEQLRALAANGGVMQTVALRGFVRTDPPGKTQATSDLMAEYGISSRGEMRSLGEDDQAALRGRMMDISAEFPVTVGDFVDHIDHAVEVMGLDHVAISSDFDGGGGSGRLGQRRGDAQRDGRAGAPRLHRGPDRPTLEREHPADPPGSRAGGRGDAGIRFVNSRSEAFAEFNQELRAYEQVAKLQRYRLAEGAEEEFDEDFVLNPCDLSPSRVIPRRRPGPVHPRTRRIARGHRIRDPHRPRGGPGALRGGARPDPRLLRAAFARGEAALPGAPAGIG